MMMMMMRTSWSPLLLMLMMLMNSSKCSKHSYVQDDGGLVISNRITLNKLTSTCMRVLLSVLGLLFAVWAWQRPWPLTGLDRNLSGTVTREGASPNSNLSLQSWCTWGVGYLGYGKEVGWTDPHGGVCGNAAGFFEASFAVLAISLNGWETLFTR